jgi:hypothetical protein
LQPWPDRTWLVFWEDEERDWPSHLREPMLDGRKLYFDAREEELEEAWVALKARAAARNRAYREEYLAFAQRDEPESHGPEEESCARLRDTLERRLEALK